jgi:hypothetical protein
MYALSISCAIFMNHGHFWPVNRVNFQDNRDFLKISMQIRFVYSLNSFDILQLARHLQVSALRLCNRKILKEKMGDHMSSRQKNCLPFKYPGRRKTACIICGILVSADSINKHFSHHFAKPPPPHQARCPNCSKIMNKHTVNLHILSNHSGSEINVQYTSMRTRVGSSGMGARARQSRPPSPQCRRIKCRRQSKLPPPLARPNQEAKCTRSCYQSPMHQASTTRDFWRTCPTQKPWKAR